jgi:hypothetical protein
MRRATLEMLRGTAAGRVSRRSLMDELETDDFGMVLALLRRQRLKLPRAPKEGREAALAALHEAVTGRPR